MPKLTQEQLATIRQRAENATPGTWFTMHKTDICIEEPPGSCEIDSIAYADRELDANFIAHARTDIPALLEHIAELEAENHRYKRAFEIISESNIRPWDSAKGMFMAHTMMVRKARRMIAEGDSYKTVNEKEDA
jgi:hypothetical protein